MRGIIKSFYGTYLAKMEDFQEWKFEKAKIGIY